MITLAYPTYDSSHIGHDNLQNIIQSELIE